MSPDMDKFEINILGCGSATPTLKHNPSSQVISYRDKLFMIDCGEGTQLEFRRQKLTFNRLNRIFISHLHGDHCLGLVGLISTLALLGRKGDLFIHSHNTLEEILRPQLDFFCRELPYNVIFCPFDPSKNELIFEDKSITVHTIPLKHRVPCTGFLFREKPKSPNLDNEKLRFHNVPIKDIARIKLGADFKTSDGKIIPNSHFVLCQKKARAYAYCSDTAYAPDIVQLIKNIDLLYHEATFTHDMLPRAIETGHSTAIQAAEIAKIANVEELLIGHFSARYNDNKILLREAKSVFKNTKLAYEGMKIEIADKLK